MQKMMLILVACLMGCGGAVSRGGEGGEGGSDAAPAGGDGGGGGTGGACACDCEPTAPSTHPIAYCEDPAHDGLACCQVDGGVCTGRACQPAQ